MADGKRWHPSHCKECGKKGTKRARISAKGYCTPCGTARMEAALRQLAGEEPGAVRDKWAANWLRAAQRANGGGRRSA